MARRRSSRSVNMMTAVLVEMGTLIGIVAVAQPTWTRGLIETVTASQRRTATLAEPVETTATAEPALSPQPLSSVGPIAPVRTPHTNAEPFASSVEDGQAAWTAPRNIPQRVIRADTLAASPWQRQANYPVLPPARYPMGSSFGY